MTPVPQPSDEENRKKTLQEFHEKNLESIEAQKKKELRAREGRQEKQQDFEERGAESVQKTELEIQEKKERSVEWRKEEKVRKLEIARDKAKRAADTTHIREQQDKDRASTEKQHAFFESFRKAASEKEHVARKKYDRGQELKAEILRLLQSARDAKLRIDTETLKEKNDIEREALQKKDSIDRDMRIKRDTLFSEEGRAKTRMENDRRQAVSVADRSPAGPERARAEAQVETDFGMKRATMQADFQKRRALLDIEERTEKQTLTQDTQKRRTLCDAEAARKKVDIDRDTVMKKHDLTMQIEKLG